MIYRPLMTITGGFAIFVGLVLLLSPMIYVSVYVSDATDGMGFLGQRLSPAIVGLGVVMLAARDLQQGPFAERFAMICSLVWFGVAASGVFHFTTGAAGTPILIAAATEMVLGVLFWVASRQRRTV